MKDWLCGKCGGLAAFVLIGGLVAGCLAWATAAALRVEREQRTDHAEAEHAGRLRLALWRLDGRIAPLLAREDSRPYDHYNALYAVPLAFNGAGACAAPGSVIVPSPLLQVELPEWMLLHFQVDAARGWGSPQVISEALLDRFAKVNVDADNVSDERRALLEELRQLSAPALLALARERSRTTTVRETSLLVNRRLSNSDNSLAANALNPSAQAPSQQELGNYEYDQRFVQQAKRLYEGRSSERSGNEFALLTPGGKPDDWFNQQPVTKDTPALTEAHVQVRPMTPLWTRGRDGADHLLLVRHVRVENREVCQGIVLDDLHLHDLLLNEVADLFPDAELLPVREPLPPHPERTLTVLPFELDPGPVPPPADPGWTPLRVGLALAWSAALIALLAVALGGWSLLDLSERRIRFVSAVTHELRTPLTTLRLYLDMLMNGLVRDEGQRAEYIRTLHAESERLSRLVGNVLDFSRLEKQRPKLARAPVRVAELLEQLRATWQGRCGDAGKELVSEPAVDETAVLCTDGELLQQVLGNLIDNACKYSRNASDRRVRVRARTGEGKIYFEVEDRGPGVPPRERHSIFRPFRRGRDADATGGGVGLGLALAKRWARLLGGRLTLAAAPAEGGACFRVELPYSGC